MAGCLDEMQKPIRNYWDMNAKSTILIIPQLKCNIISATKYSINSNLGFKNISFFFWPHHTACGILVPRTGIDPRSQQWKHWVLTGQPGNSWGRWSLFYICSTESGNGYLERIVPSRGSKAHRMKGILIWCLTIFWSE